MKRLISLAAAAAFGLASVPAAAQDEAGDKVTVVDVYGDDPCLPSSSEDEIVVCRRFDEGDRYRIPEALRQSNDPANQAWAQRIKSFETVGDQGPLSCSPVGPGGELGCTAQMIAAAYEERRTGPDRRAGELIAAARAERLSTIDAEAAATQARVEVIEREYMERVRREQEGDLPASSSATSTPRVIEPLAIPPPE